ncbi:hypothetical protein AJ80_02864 [Polytolypa hystricis UAMH7299]|uniref:Palmitoyl-protein thioesterase 1 n=1 Tax=Polytolypa hystricis (strain UAMH7299) TaxID=1447883 RepID=A0A2B7YPH3_POLH7|nr:hypothetical protein AJ80_02864 [Polytolypa hystricis UAMH7299]
MRSLLALPLLAPAIFSCTSAALLPLNAHDDVELTPLPLVIWHGLGDDYGREGLKAVAKLAEETNPGTYVHIVKLGNTADQDREATFFGNVTIQLEQVCAQLAKEPILSTAPAVNALGFSQGGQFLRAYIQRCNFPPVRNLVTFGSQHNGISKFQSCGVRGDWLCRGSEALLRLGRWSTFVQSRVVPAQYFRDPEEIPQYLKHSNFLADINNEREVKNETYKHNLMKLNKFAMYVFEDDVTVVPKESGFFGEKNMTTGHVTPLKERTLYKEDWLGLQALDNQGKLDFRTVPGEHMQVSEKNLASAFKEYFGPIEIEEEFSIQSPVLVVQN